MLRTSVGYAGGSTANPTYRSLGDHTESIRIEYEPEVISFHELLDVFWSSHAPQYGQASRQYRSLIFYHDKEQKMIAEESRLRQEERLGRSVSTEIIPMENYYLAEDYHQKYYLSRVKEIYREMRSIYPVAADFIYSTAVARLNGLVGGYGDAGWLEEHVGDLGLSEDGQRKLQEITKNGLVSLCGIPSGDVKIID